MPSPDHVDLALAVLRVTVGVVIFAHGWNHVFRGGRIEGTAGWFASLGMRPGRVHAWLASVTELVAGVLLVLGLLTPLAAGAVVGVMVVAWVTNHLTNGFFIFRPGEGWEYVATLALSALALGAMGPGGWSLDDALDLTFDGRSAFLLAFAGVPAAAALLAACWRPPAPPSTRHLGLLALGAVGVVALGVAVVGDGVAGAIVEPDQLDLGTLLLRVTVGVVIFAHGWNHVFRGGRIEGTAGWFASLGMRPGRVHAWLASVTELVAGVLLVLGLLTPLAAGAVVGVMVVAWVTNHLTNGFFIFRPGEGWEYVATLAFVSVALGVLGGGTRSLDHALDLELAGFTGLWLVLLGPAGALALLAAAWRPSSPPPLVRAAAVFLAFAAVGVLGFALDA